MITMIKKPLSLSEGFSIFKKVCTSNAFNAGSAPCEGPGMRRQEPDMGVPLENFQDS